MVLISQAGIVFPEKEGSSIGFCILGLIPTAGLTSSSSSTFDKGLIEVTVVLFFLSSNELLFIDGRKIKISFEKSSLILILKLK